MKPTLRLLCAAAALGALAACTTPPAVKTVSARVKAVAPLVADTYEKDLRATADYLEESHRRRDQLIADYRAELARAHASAAALAPQAHEAGKWRILAQWDARALEWMQRDFPAHLTGAYFGRINGRRDLLEADYQAATRAREASPDNPALLSAQRQAALRLALLDDASHRELVLLYDHLHERLAALRADYVHELGLAPAAVPPPAAPAGEAPAAPTYDPANDANLQRLRQRADEVAALKQPLADAIAAADYYLTTDGYSRVFAKAAVAGLAEAAVAEVGGLIPINQFSAAVAKFAGTKLGLSPEKTTQLEARLSTAGTALLNQAAAAGQQELQSLAERGLTKLNDFFAELKTKADTAAARVNTK